MSDSNWSIEQLTLTYELELVLVVDVMIRLNESVRVGQFVKKSRLLVCSFSRVSGSGESWFSSCSGANGHQSTQH